LIDLLNVHPQALAYGEVFRTASAIGWDVRPFAGWSNRRHLALYRSDPRAFLDRAIFGPLPSGITAVGFKLFYYHAKEPPFSDVWRRLEDDRSVRIVHLRRGNILAQYLSLQVAHRTDVWSTTSKSSSGAEPIRLDIEACRKHFESVSGWEADCARRFGSHAMHDVLYENLLADQDGAMAALQRFLGLSERGGLEARVARQRTVPLSQAILNFEELRTAFRGTAWSGFFDEAAQNGLGV
jgi:hypothetical protein